MKSLIAIPTYNRAHQIARAIDAALNQSQEDVAVVVIDDGSTDDTREVCRHWFDNPRFTYIGLGKNGGTALAKNVALALHHFDAITFHDSDDIPHRDKVLRQQRTLQRRDLVADPCIPWHLTGAEQVPGDRVDIDVVLSAHEFLAADGSIARIARTLSLIDDFFPNLQFGAGPLGDWVLVNSGLFRRNLYKRIGGYKDSVEEDREIRNRALMAGANFWFLDDVLLSKYDQADSLTATANTGYFSARRLADRQEVWRQISQWRPGSPPQVVPINLDNLDISFVSTQSRLKLAHDIAMTDATHTHLSNLIETLR
jgi:glycosyltransferase involved in cell wall biosynthesis